MSGLGTRNLLRTVRIQLKSGYLKEVPVGFELMKRIPPLTLRREAGKKSPRVRMKTASLVRKLMQKDPTIASLRTVRGDFSEESFALKFAQYQYDFMQQGFSEAEAYEKVKEKIEDIDNEAFVKLEELTELAKAENAVLPFMAEHGGEIYYWRDQLRQVPYDEMDLGLKGMLDNVVQRKILGWSKVDCMKFMSDPIFYKAFHSLIRALFPSIRESELNTARNEFRTHINDLLESNNLKAEDLNTMRPFLYEDYVFWFERSLTSSPDTWPQEDRANFRTWVIETLTLKHMVENLPKQKLSLSMDDIVKKFFPHIKSPSMAASLSLPSVQQLKQLLWENDIGYKKSDNGKLYIRRFYRLPILLFPQHMQASDDIRDLYDNDDSKTFWNDLRNVGVEEEYLKNMPNLFAKNEFKAQDVDQTSSSTDADSDIRKLLKDLEARDQDPNRGGSSTAYPDLANLDAAFEKVLQSLPKDFDIAAFMESDGSENPALKEALDKWKEWAENIEKQGEYYFYDDAVREQLLAYKAKYCPPNKTRLQQLRSEHFEKMQLMKFAEARDQEHFLAAFRERKENEAIVRARLFREFQNKEAARRPLDWSARRVHELVDTLPRLKIL